MGITDEFTLGDKLIYGIIITHDLGLFTLFVVMTIVAISINLSDQGWGNYHRYMLSFHIFASFAIAVWLSIGGIRDLIRLFKDLKRMKRDYTDDGMVRDHDYQQQEVASEK